MEQAYEGVKEEVGDSISEEDYRVRIGRFQSIVEGMENSDEIEDYRKHLERARKLEEMYREQIEEVEEYWKRLQEFEEKDPGDVDQKEVREELMGSLDAVDWGEMRRMEGKLHHWYSEAETLEDRMYDMIEQALDSIHTDLAELGVDYDEAYFEEGEGGGPPGGEKNIGNVFNVPENVDINLNLNMEDGEVSISGGSDEARGSPEEEYGRERERDGAGGPEGEPTSETGISEVADIDINMYVEDIEGGVGDHGEPVYPEY
ncbi:MAG: hypothetical protein SVS85_01990, partial [Candidatus Nanohaloarchaea archaeon]|nr:hypothetical protein [Candidatus Nanohaloarchaea archaeon]